MKVRLGDVCEILDSKRVPIKEADRNVGIYPYYGANGIQGYIDDYIFDDELVLLAEDGGHFGSKDKPIAYRVSGKCWVNNHAHVLKPKEMIDVDYLCYSLMFYDVSSFVNGATRKKLTQLDMRKMEIPFLPINEQKRIAKILDKVNELIAKRHKQLEKLDELVKARFVEMFGDPVNNDKNWEVFLLSEVTDKIGSGATPRGGKQSYQDKGVTLVRSMNVYDGFFLYKDLAHITDLQASELSNVIVQSDDVFINITGASVARSCIVPDDILPARVNQHVAIIRCKREYLEPVFLNQQLLSLSYKRLLLSLGESGGATRQALTKQQLNQLFVIVPPIELQKKYVYFVKHIERTKENINDSLAKLKILKNAIMQEYFG